MPVNSDLSTGRRTDSRYEYDFIYDRIAASAASSSKPSTPTSRRRSRARSSQEFIHAQAPIPAIGGIVRVYVVPNISITGELSGVKIPDSISKEYKAHYVDLDIYGTLNFTNNIGVQVGYRSLDVGYHVETDTGSFVLKGIYFGVVARY